MFSYARFYVWEHSVFKSLMYILQICELAFGPVCISRKNLLEIETGPKVSSQICKMYIKNSK